MKRYYKKTPLKDREDEINCQWNRMTEFYSEGKIAYYLEKIWEQDLPTREAMTFLDMQTRVNFVTGVNTNPSITDYLNLFLDHQKQASFLKNQIPFNKQ